MNAVDAASEAAIHFDLIIRLPHFAIYEVILGTTARLKSSNSVSLPESAGEPEQI
jgi:hypothetical protein